MRNHLVTPAKAASVIPAKAGIHRWADSHAAGPAPRWTPAYAGVTVGSVRP